MSWHFSQALVAASSVDTSSDGGASAPSNTTTMPAAFSSHGKTTDASRRPRSGMTFRPLTDDLGAAVLTWCLEASRARTSAPPARAPASPEPDQVSGQRWRALSVRFDPATSGWRTAHSLFGEDLAWSSLTLPRWGSLHDGELWERTTQAPRTSATGSGCWPTPTASMMPCEGTQRLLRKKWLAGALTLEEASAIGGRDIREAQGKVPRWPTPTVQDATNNGGKSQYQRNTLPLNAIAGGALNPTWVEWLMGWPLGWTDCGASAMDKCQQWCASHGMRWRETERAAA